MRATVSSSRRSEPFSLASPPILNQPPLGAQDCSDRIDSLVRLDPESPLVHNNLGNVLWRRGDLEGAETSYREVLRLDPGNANAHENLDRLLRQKAESG